MGKDTLDYISSLLSTSKEKTGKAMIQVLLSLCSKHLAYFLCCLMLKRNTLRDRTYKTL